MKIEATYLDGLMLSDGSLSYRYSKARYSQAFASEHLDWADAIKSDLKVLGIESKLYPWMRKETFIDGRRLAERMYYSLGTKSYLSLADLYRRWYIDGKKIVSRNINLTPSLLANWYLGDGSLSFDKRCPASSFLTLATESFSLADIHYLCSLLESELNISPKISILAGFNVIKISGQLNIIPFLEYAKRTHIPPSFNYKFRYTCKGQPCKRWSNREDLIVKTNYNGKNAVELAETFSRTKAAVQMRASNLSVAHWRGK